MNAAKQYRKSQTWCLYVVRLKFPLAREERESSSSQSFVPLFLRESFHCHRDYTARIPLPRQIPIAATVPDGYLSLQPTALHTKIPTQVRRVNKVVKILVVHLPVAAAARRAWITVVQECNRSVSFLRLALRQDIQHHKGHHCCAWRKRLWKVRRNIEGPQSIQARRAPDNHRQSRG